MKVRRNIDSLSNIGEQARVMCLRLVCAMPLLLFVLLVLPALVNGRRNNEPTPAARIELQRLGFRPYLQKYQSDREFFKHPYFLDDYNPRVAFIDDDTLIVFYTSKDGEIDSGKASDVARNAKLILHALLIDWHSQSLRKREEWETTARRAISTFIDSQSLIFPLSDRKFLVHAGDQLLLYSEDGQVLRKRALPVAVTGESWNVRVAPGGRKFVLRHMYQGYQALAENEWLDAESFEVLARNTDNFGLATASEDSVAVWQPRTSLMTHKIGRDPEIICATGPCLRSSEVLFLHDDEILLQFQNGFGVLSSDGRILWSRENPNITMNALLGVESSLSGNRFALRFSSGRKISFDGFELRPENNLLVYDRDTQSVVVSIHPRKGSCCTYALSPDGRYLALFEQTDLLIYDLKDYSLPPNVGTKQK